MNLVTLIVSEDSEEFGELSLAQMIHTLDQMMEEFRNADLDRGIVLSLGKAVLPQGTVITDYDGKVVSRFTLDGDLHLTTADGYTVNVSAMSRQIQEAAEEYHRTH